MIIDTFNLENLITYDVSNHEKPTKVVNFNHLINNPDKLDAFYDGGSLQHTFNIQNVLKNISNHVKIGGSIIHVCSSNNLCGFGFYQFSPEFFLNYYTKENGFINTEIFVADYDDLKNWYRVNSEYNERIYINSTSRLICLVRTEKIKESEVKDIFQLEKTNNKKKNIFVNKFILKLYFKYLIAMNLIFNNFSLKANKKLSKVNISDLIR